MSAKYDVQKGFTAKFREIHDSSDYLCRVKGQHEYYNDLSIQVLPSCELSKLSFKTFIGDVRECIWHWGILNVMHKKYGKNNSRNLRGVTNNTHHNGDVKNFFGDGIGVKKYFDDSYLNDDNGEIEYYDDGNSDYQFVLKTNSTNSNTTSALEKNYDKLSGFHRLFTHHTNYTGINLNGTDISNGTLEGAS